LFLDPVNTPLDSYERYIKGYLEYIWFKFS